MSQQLLVPKIRDLLIAKYVEPESVNPTSIVNPIIGLISVQSKIRRNSEIRALIAVL